jgi:hypothetical protein
MHSHKLPTALAVIAAALGLTELADAYFVIPQYALVFGALFLLGGWLLLRSKKVAAGAILTGILCLWEVLVFHSWPKHGAGDWISSMAVSRLSRSPG